MAAKTVRFGGLPQCHTICTGLLVAVLATTRSRRAVCRRKASSGRVAAAGPLRPGYPEPRSDHPAAERFDGQREQVLLGELLVRERGSEVGVALADESQGALARAPPRGGGRWDSRGGSPRDSPRQRAAEWAGVTNAAEGLRHWEHVRRLLRALPHTSETLQLGVTACRWSLNLAWRLCTPTANATEVFDEGRRLAEEAGDVRAQAALHGSYGCALGLVGGDSDDYVRYSREATRLADQTGDQGLRIAQRAFLGFGCTFAGRLAEGLESCATVYRTLPAEPTLGVEFTGYSPFLGILMVEAWILVRSGRLDESTAVWDRAEQLARMHGDLEVLTWMQLSRIEIDVLRDDVGAARRHATAALETGAKTANPQSLFVGGFIFGVAHRLDATWDDSIVKLDEAMRSAAGGNNRMFEAYVRAELVRALLGRGDLDRAEREAHTAVTVARTQHCRYDEVRAQLALAHTKLRRADAAALAHAEQALERAQAVIVEIGARAFEPELHECRGHVARRRARGST
jgi:hypothetical protein